LSFIHPSSFNIMASSTTTYPLDPVDISPLPPLQDSYTYHSAPFQSPEGEEWIMGIDEAGRGRESHANRYVGC
jgi:hypothetical protein